MIKLHISLYSNCANKTTKKGVIYEFNLQRDLVLTE